MKKIYLFLAVLLVSLIGFSTAAYTVTEKDQENLTKFLNTRIIPLLEKRFQSIQDPAKQAQILNSTLKSVRFVGNGGAERNATLTKLAKEQLQSKYSDIATNLTTPKTINTKKTTSGRLTTKSIANTKLGDINNDGTQFANSDGIKLQQYINGSRLNYPTDIIERGDLNSDGVINSTDRWIFQQYKVGAITTIPYIQTSSTGNTTQTASCFGSINANGISNATAVTYIQTSTNGNRGPWTPNYSWTYNTTPGICTFTCQANFSRNRSTCIAIQGQGGSFDLKGDVTFETVGSGGIMIYTKVFNLGTADFPGNGQVKLYIDNILVDTYDVGSLSRVGTTYTTFEDTYGASTLGATIGQHTARVEVTPTDSNPSNNITTKTFTLNLQNVDMSVENVSVTNLANGQYQIIASIKRAVPSYQTTHLGQTITSTVPGIPTPFRLKIRLNNELVKEEVKQGDVLVLLQSRQYLSFTHTVNSLPEQNTIRAEVISILGNDNNLTNNQKEYSFNKTFIDPKSDVKVHDLLINDGLLLKPNGERKMTISPIIGKGNGTNPTRTYKYKIFIDNTEAFESQQYGPLIVSNPRGREPYSTYFIPGTTHSVKVQINTTQGIDPNLNNNEMTKSFIVPSTGGVPPTPPTPPNPPVTATSLENIKINNAYLVSTRPNTTTINNNGTIYLRASQNDLTAKYTSLYIKFKNEGSTLNGGGQTLLLGYQCNMYNNGSLSNTRSGTINLGYTFNSNSIATAMFYNNVPAGQSAQIPYELLTTLGSKKITCQKDISAQSDVCKDPMVQMACVLNPESNSCPSTCQGDYFKLNFTVDYGSTHPLSLKTVAFTTEHVDKYINTATHTRENIPGNTSSFSNNYTTCGRIWIGINPQTGVKTCRLNKMKDLCKTVYPNTTSAVLSSDRLVNSIAGRYKPNGTGPVTKAFPYVTAFKCIQ